MRVSGYPRFGFWELSCLFQWLCYENSTAIFLCHRSLLCWLMHQHEFYIFVCCSVHQTTFAWRLVLILSCSRLGKNEFTWRAIFCRCCKAIDTSSLISYHIEDLNHLLLDSICHKLSLVDFVMPVRYLNVIYAAYIAALYWMLPTGVWDGANSQTFGRQLCPPFLSLFSDHTSRHIVMTIHEVIVLSLMRSAIPGQIRWLTRSWAKSRD